MSAEKYFNRLRRLVKSASSINGLATVMSSEIDKPGRVQYRDDMLREFNDVYGQNLEVCRRHCVTLLNEYEHNYYAI